MNAIPGEQKLIEVLAGESGLIDDITLFISIISPIILFILYKRKVNGYKEENTRDENRGISEGWILCKSFHEKGLADRYKEKLDNMVRQYIGTETGDKSSLASDKLKTDFILKEFERYSDLFKENEILGERRVNIFLTLITSILSAIGLTIVATNFELSDGIQKNIVLFGSFILLFLFFYGMFTLRRIVGRNVDTDEYKIKLDVIRMVFKVGVYDEITRSRRKIIRKSLGFQRGGFAETIKLLNSVLVGSAYVGLWIYPILSSQDSLQDLLSRMVLAFFIGFVGAWVSQTIFVNYFYINDEEWKIRAVLRDKHERFDENDIGKT